MGSPLLQSAKPAGRKEGGRDHTANIVAHRSPYRMQEHFLGGGPPLADFQQNQIMEGSPEIGALQKVRPKATLGPGWREGLQTEGSTLAAIPYGMRSAKW